MNNQELDLKLNLLQKEFELKKQQVMIEFCDSNNPYKVGDKFTDHIGSIIIEKIGYSFTARSYPCCIYRGRELKKDGTPKKNNNMRDAWQFNDTSSPVIVTNT